MEEAAVPKHPHMTRLQRWLRIAAADRPHIYAQVYDSAEFSSVSYWLEIVFSAGIAVLGLVVNSPAVIIGAMLISPLMGPIMATGLALAAGDLYLAVKAIAKLVVSIALAIALSAAIVWLLPFHSITGEILARINPNLLDLGIALFSGLAGSVAVCRTAGGSGVTTLPGVAIAVALMPPLCTVGFGLGSGANTRIMGGAGLLFLTNLVAIVSSAFLVFLLVGMNAPDVRTQMESSRRDEPLARRMSQGPLARVLADGSQLHWRILMLLVLLATIAVPLRRAFVQVAGEAVVRSAVQDAEKQVLAPETIVSQQVEVGRGNVAIRLISTQSVPAEKLRDAEREIERRSGFTAHMSVASIASQSELAELTQRLTAPPAAPPPPPVKTLDQLQTELMARVQPVITAIWPQQAPLHDFDVAFSPGGIIVHAEYESVRDLGQIPLDLIQGELRDKLAVPALTLDAKRVPPVRKGRTR
ncbi:MAG TPA: DUF389 domain-containing protein [Terracidiphilus sp.]|nr:DUF389 domain-containing protein [Terracidiphilus sp.]